MRNFCDTRTNVVRVLYDSHATLLRKHANTSRLSGEKIKLSRMSRDCRTNENENKLHWRESCETLSRMSCDSREIYFQNLTEIHKFVA